MLRCNDMSAVAVIMSVYKNDKLNWFKEAIESLKSQDIGWENINLYLGIDGELPMEVEEYISELSPYKVIKNEKNMGLAATLNKLISELDSE
ncbi:glycosyltransferase, partial [Vibrio parahaemolyticus]|nr:glycosyltransferase [Vibrio parahaemolyticus]